MQSHQVLQEGDSEKKGCLSGEQVCEGVMCFTKNKGFMLQLRSQQKHEQRDHFSRKGPLTAGVAYALREGEVRGREPVWREPHSCQWQW